MKKIFFFMFIVSSFVFYGISYSQFGPDIRLTNDTSVSEKCYNNSPGIAVNGSYIYVVWSDFRGSSNEKVYFKRSTDGGASWESDVQLTTTPSSSVYPVIAAFGTTIHVVWQDHRVGGAKIYYKRSVNYGASWEPDVQLSFGTNSFSEYPSIAITGPVVHVVWQDDRDGNKEIYYKRSTNDGVSWEQEMRITNSSGSSLHPSIYAPGAYVHVAWSDDRDGNKEIYYKRSLDAGVTWLQDMRLTSDTAESNYPSVSIGGNVVYVVWQDNRTGWDIYGKRSLDGGSSWESDTRLTNDISNSFYPSLISSTNILHVVWQDVRDGNWEIYYKRSLNDGATWENDTRLTNSAFDSFYPSVTVSGTAVYVYWQDNRDGNFEMYFKTDPTGNPIGIVNISSEVPQSFSLLQNYPNPFNPETNIKFLVSKQAFVNIAVYDNLGREITTLVNQQLNPGTYRVNWNASNYPSGVYFYKLISDKYTETRKMVLLK